MYGSEETLGLRSVPCGKKEEDIPICPVFEQIEEKFGGSGLAVCITFPPPSSPQPSYGPNSRTG